MELQDHAYTSITEDKFNPMEYIYKMSKHEIEDFVKLRVTNDYLFSGKRNTSMWAWRAILKHMGLQHKMTHCQASKKWENMKKRYRDLKNPPEGVKVVPQTWPYFSLMDDAMAGRLEGNAPVLKACPSSKNSADFLRICKPKKRKVPTTVISSVLVGDDGPEIEVSLSGDEDGKDVLVLGESQEIDRIMQEVEDERNGMVSEHQVMERERLVLQRERAVLDREIAVLERDRALLERERATMEREKAVLERERAMVAMDRDAICKERLALEQEKARLDRLSVEVTEGGGEVTDSGAVDRKERFLSLFEKLLEKF